MSEVFAYLVANYAVLVSAVAGVLTALVGVFLLVPGEQPEKALQGVVDVIKKLSLK